MVYYGDEAGIDAPGRSGFGDPYNRAPYPWTDASGNVDTYGPPADYMLSWYTRLGALRHSLPALRTEASSRCSRTTTCSRSRARRRRTGRWSWR